MASPPFPPHMRYRMVPPAEVSVGKLLHSCGIVLTHLSMGSSMVCASIPGKMSWCQGLVCLHLAARISMWRELPPATRFPLRYFFFSHWEMSSHRFSPILVTGKKAFRWIPSLKSMPLQNCFSFIGLLLCLCPTDDVKGGAIGFPSPLLSCERNK